MRIFTYSIFAFLGLLVLAVPNAQAQERLVKTADDPKVYAVADNGTKRWLQTPSIFSSYGYDFGAVEIISNQALASIPDTKAVRLNDNPGVYILTDELVIRGVGSLDTLSRMGFSLSDVVSVNSTQFNSYEEGSFIREGDIPITPTTESNLIRANNTTRVYAVAPNGTKRWFRSPAVLRSYGFSFSQVRDIPQSEVVSVPNTKAIRLEGQAGIYRLNNDWTKQGIGSTEVFRSLGLSMNDVVVVNRVEFNSYPTGPFLVAPQERLTWRDYVSEGLGFTMEFPVSMSTNRTAQDTIRFRLLGPDQGTGTEITDGILVTVRRESLEGMSLRDYAAHRTVEGPLVEDIIEPVHAVSINGIGGYSATVETLGVVTHVFLPSVEGATFHISYVNPDPNDRGYDQIVDRMLSTFTRL